MPTRLHRTYWLPRSGMKTVKLRTLFAFALLTAPFAVYGQNYQGSVPSGSASSTPIALSFADAIDRGLKTNLGILTSEQSSEEVRAQRLRALSALLPQVTGQLSMTEQQLNLQAFGFNIKLPPSAGFQIPKIVKPYSYQAALLNASIPLFDYKSISSLRAVARIAEGGAIEREQRARPGGAGGRERLFADHCGQRAHYRDASRN